jgi:hypothetical protein
MADQTQIVVALIGALSPIIPAVIKVFSERAAAGKVAESGAAPALPAAPPPRSDYIRLAFTLLAATILSVIATDSLLVSGRAPALNVGLLGEIVGITVLVTAPLLTAWKLRATEVGIGLSSALMICVLLLSPGGAFVASVQLGGERGISVILPLSILLILTCAAACYRLGNPLSRRYSLKNRAVSAGIIVACTVVCAVTSGKQIVSTVESDGKSPRILEDDAKHLLSEVENLPHPKKVRFYQLASELQLSAFYQEIHLQTESTMWRPEPTTEAVPAPAPAEAPAPAPAPPQGRAEERRHHPAAPVKATSPVPAPQIVVKTGVSDTSAHDTPAQKEALRRERLREIVHNVVGGSFDTPKQIQFLTDRLWWIHPVGDARNPRSDIALPGITAKDRGSELSRFRAIRALLEQQNTLDSYLETFSYDSRIYDKEKVGGPFRTKASNVDGAQRFSSEFFSSAASSYVPLPTQEFTPQLLEELALPLNVDFAPVSRVTAGQSQPWKHMWA